MNAHELEYLTIAEAVRSTGIGRTKFYSCLQSGQIEAVKFGRRTLVRSASLRAFMADLPKFVTNQ